MKDSQGTLIFSIELEGQLILYAYESFVITHKLSLDDAPDAYRRFRDKEDGCIKVMLRP